MFGNNINNPFMMNNMYGPSMMGNAMMRGTPMMGNMMRSVPMMSGPKSSGLLSSFFGRGGASTIGGISKTFNFGSLLTNTSKVLGVVKDAIPIVKEVGPMVGNMKQMLKIASIFKDETDTSTTRNTKTISKTSSSSESSLIEAKENDTNIISTTKNQNSNEPNFFL